MERIHTRHIVRLETCLPKPFPFLEFKKEKRGLFNIVKVREGFHDTVYHTVSPTLSNKYYYDKEKDTVFIKPCLKLYLSNGECRTFYYDTEGETTIAAANIHRHERWLSVTRKGHVEPIYSELVS